MPEHTTFTVERVSDPAALAALREAWNALLATNATRTAELTHEWQATYWKHFSQDAELFVLAVKDGPEVIGIASMRLIRRRVLGVRVRELRFIADKESNYQDFIIGRDRPAVMQAIADYLKAHHDQWDILYLARLPAEADTCAWFEQAFAGWGHSRVENVEKVVSIQVDRGWETYSQATRKHRRHATRCGKKLRTLGVVDSYHCQTAAQITEHLERFFAYHRQRWNSTATPSQFNDPRACAFYHEASLALFAKGELDLFVLTVDDAPVGYVYCFLYGDVALMQLVTYGDGYQYGSPGIVCIEAYVQEVFKMGVRVGDMGSYFPYKEMWFDQFSFRKNFELYPPGDWMGRYVFAVREFAHSPRVVPVTDAIRRARHTNAAWLWRLAHGEAGKSNHSDESDEAVAPQTHDSLAKG